MAREKEGYRDQLEVVLAAFPAHDLLSPSEVAEFCGCSRRTISRRIPPTAWIGTGCGKRITRSALARFMCK